LFRGGFAEHFGGFDLAVAPFIASKRGHRIKRKYVKEVLPENNSRMPVIPQILSKTPADFITDERVLALFITTLRRFKKDNEKNHKNVPAGSVSEAGEFVFRNGSKIAAAEGGSFGLKCLKARPNQGGNRYPGSLPLPVFL
jgi:hypothetical protein